MFGFYLEENIDKLNSFINDDKERDYIKNNKIKFGFYDNHYYLCCCYLNEKFKENYYNGKNLIETMKIPNAIREDNIKKIEIET